ncbi:DNA-binding response regulator [uncultured Jatrophihabitans sp.]|uniref:response regulator transcription factor n=1 Tax=uncultured Jatrophihabitans sp. TaxID=1610747 RepID=UPI0035CC97E8
MIKLVVAEDEQLMRDAVVSLLGMEPDLHIVGTAADGIDAVAAVREHRPDVALLDLEMPGMDGVQVVERLAAQALTLRCVIVTRHARPGVLRRALAAGVAGFVSKTVPAATLADVIRRVHRGGRYVDPELALTALDTRDSPLTDRELDVLRHVRPTATATDIAQAVNLAPGTVRNYLSSAMHKLGVHNRLEAADRARDHGWL